MRVSYSDGYFVPLPEGHPFPMAKFPALHRILEREGLVRNGHRAEPAPAAREVLGLVHTDRYLDELETGLERAAERRLGLPWSPALMRRSRLAVGGTVLAARMALEDGISANLAGGTHHAYPDHGEGFCVLNDVAVAIRLLRGEGLLDRALVIDLDVHQGNGTAAVFAADPRTFTLSFHGQRNYPFQKEASSLDVGLPDATGDDELPGAAGGGPAGGPAGQPARPDRLPGRRRPPRGRPLRPAGLTRDGLHRRDRAVLRAARASGAALLLVMSGGYASSPEATADLHAVAHREARRVYGGAA